MGKLVTVPVELVKVVTPDGLRLDGSWQSPHDDVARRAETAEARSALLLHGAGSNFYAGGLFEQLSPTLMDRGIHVLRVNTRGHDGYYTGRTVAGVIRLGAAYERVADCTLDLAGWLNWLAQRDLLPTVLIGHSLGAIKAVYSQAEQSSETVAGVIAISPPRLSCSAFQWGPQAEPFGQLLREAKQLVQQNAGKTVIESTFPFPMLITAEAFLDKYGGETYNVVRLAEKVPQPLWFLYGENELREGGVAFAGVPEALREAGQDSHPSRNVQIIEGADHFYVGCSEALAEHVSAAWHSICSAPRRPSARLDSSA